MTEFPDADGGQIACEVTGLTTVAGEVVAAWPEQVWDLAADVTRVGGCSPECIRTAWLGQSGRPQPGARFTGHNRFPNGFEYEPATETMLHVTSSRKVRLASGPRQITVRSLHRHPATARSRRRSGHRLHAAAPVVAAMPPSHVPRQVARLSERLLMDHVTVTEVITAAVPAVVASPSRHPAQIGDGQLGPRPTIRSSSAAGRR